MINPIQAMQNNMKLTSGSHVSKGRHSHVCLLVL
jgi:hypothetical protein